MLYFNRNTVLSYSVTCNQSSNHVVTRVVLYRPPMLMYRTFDRNLYVTFRKLETDFTYQHWCSGYPGLSHQDKKRPTKH